MEHRNSRCVIQKFRHKFSEKQQQQIEKWKKQIITPDLELKFSDLMKEEKLDYECEEEENKKEEESGYERIDVENENMQIDPWELFVFPSDSKKLIYSPRFPCP